MECEESPQGAAAGGFDPVTPKGEYRDFVAGGSGVFTCANMGRFSTDYERFDYEFKCEYLPEEQRAVLTPTPVSWRTCKTSKLNFK